MSNGVAALSDDQFDVTEDGPSSLSPRQAIESAAAVLIGDGPERRPDGLDPEEIEAKVISKGIPKAKLFQMSDPDLAQEYAVLEHTSKTTGTVMITKIKELVDGTSYALFVCWIEFPQPKSKIEDSVRLSIAERTESVLRRLTEAQAIATSKERTAAGCRGRTTRGKACRSRVAPGKMYCRRHETNSSAGDADGVSMDRPPPTHAPLGGTP